MLLSANSKDLEVRPLQSKNDNAKSEAVKIIV